MKTRFVLIIAIFQFIQNTNGGTILSSNGVGTPFYFPNTRSMGMGNLSIAQCDSFTIARINPAGLYTIKTTRISLQYFYEHNRYKDNINGSATSNYSNFYGFTFVLPLGSGTGLAVGLAPVTRMDYNLTFSDTLMGEPYTKSIEGQGGLNTFNFSFYWAIRHNFALGLSGNYLFGKLKEEWKVIYEGKDFRSSDDIFSTKNWGYRYTAGMVYRPFKFLLLGAVFSPKTNLNNRTDIHYAFFKDSSKTHTGSFLFPGYWGIGTFSYIKKVGHIGIEFSQQDWTTLQINNKRVKRTGKTQRISIGYESFPSRDYSVAYTKRMTYRLGFYYQPYFLLDPGKKTIAEKWITIGIGFPISKTGSQINVALGFGKRGSVKTNGLSENLLRLSLSITGGEKWFVRHY